MKSLLPTSSLLLAAALARAAAFSPDEAVSHAVRHQPELAAARLLVEEARARRDQSGLLANPELEAEARPHVNGREGIVAFGLIQRFPLTARLQGERRVSEAAIAAAEAELLAAERQLAGATALAVADWLAVGARLHLIDRQLTNARAFATALRTAADRGEVSALDARQITLEAGQTALRRRQVEQRQVALRGELRRLLNLGPDEPVELSGTLPPGGFPTPVPSDPSTDDRPEVRIALARLEAARRETELERARRWQDVGLGLVGEVQRSEDEPVGMQRDGFVGLRLALPLPFWNRNAGGIREAGARVERRQLELEAARLRIRSEQAAARESLDLAVATEREWREEQLPLAREIEDRLESLRTGGQVAFTDWARARERRLQAEAGHLDARSDLLRTWIGTQISFGHTPRFPDLP